jgi:hypothetical protein
LGSLEDATESIKLKDAALGTDGSKHLSTLPKHLQKLLYHWSYVPGKAEPTNLLANDEGLISQHTLARATSLMKMALR